MSYDGKFKLNAKQLRSYSPLATGRSQLETSSSPRCEAGQKRNDIYIVLDNVLDTYNIGSIFRLADAVAAKKIYLCGGTETPPNHRIKKASINTTEWVEWEYSETAVEAIKKVKSLWKCHPEGAKRSKNLPRMRDSNLSASHFGRELSAERLRAGKSRDSSLIAQNDRGVVVAIEQSKKSIQYDKFDYKLPILLIVGNETTGVSKEVLQSRMLDGIVEIPMFGVNKSLNVMVSLGIVLYEVIEQTAA